MFRKLKNSLVLIIFILGILFLFSNNVSAAFIESSDSLEEVFIGDNVSVSGKTITLTGDFEDGDVYEIGGDDYTLDLNGYKFIAGEIYVNDGSLTIKDSRENGELITTGNWFWVEEGAKLTVNGGKINYLENGGTTIINNGTIENLTNDATMTINDGNFTYFWQRGKSVVIKGGTFGPSTIDLERGSTLISGSVEFKKVDEYRPLTIYSANSIDTTVINQLVGEGYISGTNERGSNSYPDELRETGMCYEVTYGPLLVIKDETDAIFNKIAPNGVWKITGSKPKDMHESEFMLSAMVGDIKLPEGYTAMAWVEPAEKFNPEKVSIFIYYNKIMIKEKIVKAVYNEPSKEVKTKVNSVLDKIAEKTGNSSSEENGFRLEDLYLINYLNASSNGMNSSLALNFSKELIALTNGGNISYKYDSRKGAFTPTGLWGFTGGQVIVYYDGVAVGTTEIGLTTSNVLYVPSETADTDDAKIAAALKRIKEYLGTTEGITIEKGGTLDSLNKDGYTWKDYDFIDATTSGANYYNVTINDETYKFAICKKDADELETPEYLASDIISNIAVKSTSTEVPLDTAVSVKNVNDKNIKKALGTDNYAAYDITLYSNTKGAKITKLDNGKFVVSIPVPDSLKNIKTDKLTVYYINEKGEKEDYFATIKDGIATFETDHFSTYAIAEKTNTIKNPNTSDNVLLAIETLAVSMAGAVVAIKCIKK